MKYIELHNYLRDIINYEDSEIKLDQTTVLRNFSFKSNYRFLLPGGMGNKDDYEYIPSVPEDYEPDVIQNMLNKKDTDIHENLDFRYHIIMPSTKKRASEILLFFHGFNEKYWSKYLPWAHYLANKTGKAVLMFPIAYHMNRAPALWSDTRNMYKISQQRKKRHPEVINSSLSNVAISTRLHNKPQRFIWSGLQSYYDVIDLVEYIKADKHPAIEPDAKIDFFSYSIGAFLGEILMMTNKEGYFSKSRYASFCGGATFNRLSPVSKFILDSEANVSLYSFVVEHLESHMKRDEILRHYLSNPPEGKNLRSMLNYQTFIEHREGKFRAMSDRIYAITLKNDEVVPSYEVINTLKGIHRDIPIKVEELDFPYPYIHENPFPLMDATAKEVNKQFEFVFDKFVEFLSIR